MHAIILAGGFGTRLRSAVSDVPKPLAPIAGRPFLAWFVDMLIGQGVTSVTLSVHHDWEKIRDYFTTHPVTIPLDYAVEETPLGTGGAIVYALKKHAGKAPVIVLNGDSFIQVDVLALYAQHQKNNAKFTMVLRSVSDAGRYGNVEEQDGIITSFSEGVAGKSGLINAGVYVLNKEIFNEKLPDAFSFERDFLPPRLKTLKAQSFRADNYFIDIGIPEDYARACKELPEMIALAGK